MPGLELLDPLSQGVDLSLQIVELLSWYDVELLPCLLDAVLHPMRRLLDQRSGLLGAEIAPVPCFLECFLNRFLEGDQESDAVTQSVPDAALRFIGHIAAPSD